MSPAVKMVSGNNLIYLFTLIHILLPITVRGVRSVLIIFCLNVTECKGPGWVEAPFCSYAFLPLVYSTRSRCGPAYTSLTEVSCHIFFLCTPVYAASPNLNSLPVISTRLTSHSPHLPAPSPQRSLSLPIPTHSY